MGRPWMPLLLVLCTVAVLGSWRPARLTGAQATALPEVGISDDEYAIYRVLVSSKGLVRGETEFEGFGIPGDAGVWQGLGKELGATSDLVERYRAVCQESWRLDPERLQRKCLGKEELERCFHDSADGWERFWRRHPQAGGIWTVSRVGFSRDRDKAIVYADSRFGELAGWGALYLMARTRSGWKVVKTCGLWVS